MARPKTVKLPEPAPKPTPLPAPKPATVEVPCGSSIPGVKAPSDR